MASRSDNLPEGTDSIIAGASDQGTAEHIEASASEDPGPFGRFSEQTSGLRSQAFDKARDYANQGKDRATDALDGLSRVVGDTARTVDQSIGAEYGDYARRAADAVQGMATNLRNKDVDELYDDARTFVRSSPALAIGVAAVVGFSLVRLIKSGAALAQGAAAPTDDTDKATGKAKASSGRESTAKSTPKKSTKPAG